MNKNKQDQRSGDNSTNIQAGSITIQTGLTYNDVKEIAEDVFKNNFLIMTGQAKLTAEQRANDLIENFLNRLKQENPSGLETAKDPDMQIALFSAQKSYARYGHEELRNLLVDLLIKRTQTSDNDLKKIVLNEALEVAPKLTVKQLNSISIRFLIVYSKNDAVNSIESFNTYLNKYLLPFCSYIANEQSDYQHIEYAGCGTVGVLFNDIYAAFKNNYAGILSKGFDMSSLGQLQLTIEQQKQLIVKCLRDSTKYQINAINDMEIEAQGKNLGLNDNLIPKVKELQNSNLITADEFEHILVNVDVRFKDLLKIWRDTGLGRLQLTTVGIALAHANIKRMINEDLDLGIWIK